MTTTILPSRNEAWGFFGTTQSAGADPMQAWNAASAMIAAATDASPEGVRDFFDSSRTGATPPTTSPTNSGGA